MLSFIVVAVQAAEVLRAAAVVRDALVVSGLPNLLNRAAAGGTATWPTMEDVLTCHGGLSAQAQHFNGPERALLAELRLSIVLQPGWWGNLIRAIGQGRLDDASAASLAATRTQVDLAINTLPQVLTLLSPAAAEDDAATLSLLLITDDGSPPHPLRLSAAIQGVALLWDALCDLRGADAAMQLVSCDSTGGATIRFTGDPDTMLELKSVLLGIWEQVMLHHDLSLHARLSAIPPSLSVMDRIAVTRPGNAVALRHRMQEGVRRILETGACIPEMRVPDRFTPSDLMRPQDAGDESSTPGTMPPQPAPPPATQAPRQQAQGSPLDAIIAEERREMTIEGMPSRRR